MIRLGQLKAVVSIAGPYQQGKEQFNRKFGTLITRRQKVDFSTAPNVKNYLEAKQIAKAERERMLSSGEVEFQDLYLADPTLPSNLGRVPLDVAHEIVDWATWLKLIRPNLFSLSALGQVLRALMSEEEKKSLSEFDRSHNPFLVRIEGPFLLYLILAADGDMIRRLYVNMANSGMKHFERLEAVSLLRQACSDLLEESRREDSYMKHAGERKKLQSLLETLDKEKTTAETAKKRALTGIQLLSPRLENLVDLGIIENSSSDTNGFKLEYQYQVTERTLGFAKSLGNARDVSTYLREQHFETYCRILGTNAKKATDPDLVMRYLIRGYFDVGRDIGPAPITYAALSGATRALAQENVFFEAADGLDVLLRARERYPDQVHLSGGEIRGRPEFVALSNDLRDKFGT